MELLRVEIPVSAILTCVLVGFLMGWIGQLVIWWGISKRWQKLHEETLNLLRETIGLLRCDDDDTPESPE